MMMMMMMMVIMIQDNLDRLQCMQNKLIRVVIVKRLPFNASVSAT
jgi:hypothetical protein